LSGRPKELDCLKKKKKTTSHDSSDHEELSLGPVPKVQSRDANDSLRTFLDLKMKDAPGIAAG
jgi:hypothetical protein